MTRASKANCRRMPMLVLATAAMLAANVPAVDTLVWTGKYDSYFDTAGNWTNRATGAEQSFTLGAQKSENVVFDVGEGESATVIMRTKAVYNPTTTRFDVDGTLWISNTTDDAYFGWQQGAWAKYGKGTVYMSTNARIFIAPGGGTDALTIHAGTFDFTGYKAFTHCFTSKKNIIVKDGARFSVHGRNLEGDITSLQASTKIKVVVEKGGHFHIDSIQNAEKTFGHNMLPKLELNDGSAFDFHDYAGHSPDRLGMFTLASEVVLNGTGEPYSWNVADCANAANAHIHFLSEPATELRVADVTGSDAVDFHLGLPVFNHCIDNNNKTFRPAGFIKTGPGTMALTNHLNAFTGDIEVREGTLQFGPETASGLNVVHPIVLRNYTGGTSWMGSQAAARTFSVSNGATIYIPHRNVWGQYTKITNSTCGATTIFLDGGTLKFRDGQVNVVPNITVTGGSRLFEALGSYGSGVGMIAGTFKVTGSAAFDWPWHNVDEPITTTTIGRTAICVAGYPETVFDIEDVTGNAGVDCAIHLPFIVNNYFLRPDVAPLYDLDDWFFGFRKTGAGTMRLTAPSFMRASTAFAPLNGYVTVAAGTLQVDGGMLDKTSNIVVNASAFLAGTGTVNRVTFDDGAGFRALASQAQPLAVLDTCAFGAGGIVELENPESLSAQRICAKLMSIGGGVAGRENLAGWTVKVDGVAQPRMSVRLRNGVLCAEYRRGLTIVFK